LTQAAAALPDDRRALLLDCFRAALAAVDARAAVQRELERRPLAGDWHVLGVGKAAGAMALGAAQALGGRLAGGLVVVPDGHVPAGLASAAALVVVESSHPMPDERSLATGERLLSFVAALPPRAQVLCLVSGGASSLVEVLRPGLTLADLQCVNRWALESGAAIGAVNAVRRRLSRIKDGGLAAQLGARRVRALFVSDVPGDDPATIGSGLLHRTDGRAVAQGAPPPEVAAILARCGPQADAASPPVDAAVVASVTHACRAVARRARSAGVHCVVGRDRFDGDAGALGARFAAALSDGRGTRMRAVGGESTVQLPAVPGRGGRNQHLALGAACELERQPPRGRAWLLAGATDGVDGNTGDAGALVDAGTCRRGRDAGYDPHVSLARADSGTFLEGAGALLHTGPTLTNVGDLVLTLRDDGKT
jgi:hydroxypyruvate reductase